MIKRYEELDSLRGIAALIVLFCHLLFIFPSIGDNLNAKFGIVLSILWDGHSAVIIFFVLSGFVLSLPFYKDNKPNYIRYLIKRICRIYVPYISVIIIAILTKMVLDSKLDTIPHLSGWGLWNIEISLKQYLIIYSS